MADRMITIADLAPAERELAIQLVRALLSGEPTGEEPIYAIFRIRPAGARHLQCPSRL